MRECLAFIEHILSLYPSRLSILHERRQWYEGMIHSSGDSKVDGGEQTPEQERYVAAMQRDPQICSLSEFCTKVENAVAMLPEPERQFITSRCFLGMDYAEIERGFNGKTAMYKTRRDALESVALSLLGELAG